MRKHLDTIMRAVVALTVGVIIGVALTSMDRAECSGREQPRHCMD